MSRETKVGLIVAFAFLFLVGSVVVYKMYLSKEPLLSQREEEAASPREAKAAVEAKEELQPIAQIVIDPNVTPAQADTGMGLSAPRGRPADPGVPPPVEEPLPPAASGAAAAEPPSVEAARPPVVEPAPASGRPAPPDPEPASLAPSSRPAPPVEEGPNLKAPPIPPPVNLDVSPPLDKPEPPPVSPGRSGRPEPVHERQPETPPPAPAPIPEEPRPAAGARPSVTVDPTPATNQPAVERGSVDAASAAAPVEPKSSLIGAAAAVPLGPARSTADPGMVSPPPSGRTFERTYDVPRPPAASRPEQDTGGIPVALRMQPDTVKNPPPPPAGSSVILQPEPLAAVPLRPQAGPTAQVEVFDVAQYVVRPGDTFSSISQAKYGTDRYQQALALFNRERDSRLDSLQPGRPIYLPPSDYLERRYGGSSPSMAAAARPVSRDYQVQPAASAPRQGTGVTQASTHAAGGASASSSGEKSYRVQANDTIWGIAKRTLGQGERWPEILRLNRDQLRDVNHLQAGMVLRLPADARVDSGNYAP